MKLLILVSAVLMSTLSVSVYSQVSGTLPRDQAPDGEGIAASPGIFLSATSPGAASGYQLPSGVELVVGDYRSTFSCEGRIYGYYADQDNSCQIFHVCVPSVDENGVEAASMYSFFCGNQTVFDQQHLTCAHLVDALPCEQANSFFNVNEEFGKTDKPLLRAK